MGFYLFLIFQGCKTSFLTAKRAQRVAVCNECHKPRVVYCLEPWKVSQKELLDLHVCIREFDYTCGSHLLPSSHYLYKKVCIQDPQNVDDI